MKTKHLLPGLSTLSIFMSAKGCSRNTLKMMLHVCQWQKQLACYVLAVLSFSAMAQGNNPYDQQGKDYTKSLAIISSDYYAGKVKEFNEETLQHYSRAVPLGNQVSSEMAADIVRITKTPGFNFREYVDASKNSDFIKASFKELYSNLYSMKTEAYRQYLSEKVESVKSASCSEEERTYILSMIAIIYNLQDQEANAKSGSTGARYGAACSVTSSEGTQEAPCAVVGAIMGGIIGFGICGILCGIGGAIIGGVAGSLS